MASLEELFNRAKINDAIKAENLSPHKAEVFKAIHKKEFSPGDPTSNAGAVGPMQMIQATFDRYANKDWNIHNPEHNLRAAARYISDLHDKTNGNIEAIAQGYYGGEGAIGKNRSDPRNPKAPTTFEYGKEVAGNVQNNLATLFSKAKESRVEIPTAEIPTAPRLNPLEGLGNELIKNLAATTGAFGSEVNPIAKFAKDRGIPIPADIASNFLKGLESEGESLPGKIGADIITGIPLMFAGPAGMASKPGIIPFIANSLKNIGYNAATGGAQTALTTEGDISDRGEAGLVSGLISGSLGTLVQSLKGAGVLGKKGYNRFITPEKYTDKKAAEIIQEFTHNPLEAARNIETAQKFVSGYRATAAELANDEGLNSLQKHSKSFNPSLHAVRDLENNMAQYKQLEKIAGTRASLDRVLKANQQITKPLYDAATSTDTEVSKGLVKLLERPNMNKAFDKSVLTLRNGGINVTPEYIEGIKKGYKEINTGLFDQNNKPIIKREPAFITGEHLDLLKKSADELPKDPTSSMGQSEYLRHIKTVQAFEKWREVASPKYKEAQDMFRKLSEPPNIRKTALLIKDKTYPAINEFSNKIIKQNPTVFADLISNLKDTSLKATGIKGLSFPVAKEQSLRDIASNMARKIASQASDAGEFTEPSEQMIARIGGGVLSPLSPGAYQAGSAALIDMFSKSNKAVKQKLSQILLDPEETRKFLLISTTDKHKFLGSPLVNKFPGIAGPATFNSIKEKQKTKKP